MIDGQQRLSYSRLLAAVLAFKAHLRSALQPSKNVGILLPASAATVIANMATLMSGRAVVNLAATEDAQVAVTADMPLGENCHDFFAQQRFIHLL